MNNYSVVPDIITVRSSVRHIPRFSLGEHLSIVIGKTERPRLSFNFIVTENIPHLPTIMWALLRTQFIVNAIWALVFQFVCSYAMSIPHPLYMLTVCVTIYYAFSLVFSYHLGVIY